MVGWSGSSSVSESDAVDGMGFLGLEFGAGYNKSLFASSSLRLAVKKYLRIIIAGRACCQWRSTPLHQTSYL